MTARCDFQNDLTLVKLLLNYDYNKDIAEKPAEMLGKNKKPMLEKQFSRQIFTIRPDKRAEEMEKDPSDNEDEGEEDDDDEMEGGIEDEAAALEEEEDEEEVEVNGMEGEEEEPVEEEEEEFDGGEDDGDSEHDTDVMDDEEDEEHPPAPAEPLPRLGSKQMSLARMSSASKKGQSQFHFLPCQLAMFLILVTCENVSCSLKFSPWSNRISWEG